MSDKRQYLYLGQMMEGREIKAEELSSIASVAYNTALSYQRDASERLSKDVLGRIADSLNVDVFELFMTSDDRERLISTARLLGVENPEKMKASEMILAMNALAIHSDAVKT